MNIVKHSFVQSHANFCLVPCQLLSKQHLYLFAPLIQIKLPAHNFSRWRLKISVKFSPSTCYGPPLSTLKAPLRQCGFLPIRAAPKPQEERDCGHPLPHHRHWRRDPEELPRSEPPLPTLYQGNPTPPFFLYLPSPPPSSPFILPYTPF